jgi:hypothetical protein
VILARRTNIAVPAVLLGFAVFCALVLALPGQTVLTKYVAELIIPLDGAYRVVAGQVPHRDFHSALGPLAYYIPAAGYLVSGRLGAAMPVGMALVTVLLAPAIAYVLQSRVRPVIAIPFGLFVILVLVVPINLGESVTSLSFAKFYNNIGWAGLATLLVMYLRPVQTRSGQDAFDLACAAALTLLLVYTKLSFGLAALAFLVALLFDPRQRRWAGGALACCALAALIIEWLWRGSLPYLADLGMAAKVSGFVRGTVGQILDHVLGNLADYVLLVVFASISLWRTRSVPDLLFYLACAVGGFLLINQNFQAWGILSLHAAAVVAVETYLRCADLDGPEDEDRAWSVQPGVQLLFVALVLPTIVHCLIALGLHATAATARAGREIALPRLAGIRLANLWTWADYDIAAKSIAAIEDGAGAVSSLEPKPTRVFVLDLANPFSAGLGLEPPRGDSSWLLWGRNTDAATFYPAERLLSDVQIVAEPKPPIDAGADPRETASEALRALYRPYLASNFAMVRETELWKIHRRTDPRARVAHPIARYRREPVTRPGRGW